jgi:hypothetical protein
MRSSLRPIYFLIVVLVGLWIRPVLGQNQSPRTDSPSTVQPSNASQEQNAHPSSAQSAPGKNGGDGLSLNWSDVEQTIWANAKTYVDLPVAEVAAAVPELKELTAETSPRREGLASLLDHVGQSCTDLLQHTPNLASREEQITQQRGVSRISQGTLVPVMSETRRDRQEFGYLLLSHVTADGIELREYRTDKHGRPIVSTRSQGGQMTEGFVSEWLRLLPGNQLELRFRYLGTEEIDGRETRVIAFAQIPEHVKYPAQFSFEGMPVTVLFQGIVWVDASDFRLVRMREDLLAPRPDLHLRELTMTIHFAEVQIPKAATALWLPKEVAIAWEYKGLAVEQRHLYSDFRLYEVHSKIVPQ